MLRGIAYEEEKDYLKTMLLAKAAVLDKTLEKDVIYYNKLVEKYQRLVLGGESSSTSIKTSNTNDKKIIPLPDVQLSIQVGKKKSLDLLENQTSVEKKIISVEDLLNG